MRTLPGDRAVACVIVVERCGTVCLVVLLAAVGAGCGGDSGGGASDDGLTADEVATELKALVDDDFSQYPGVSLRELSCKPEKEGFRCEASVRTPPVPPYDRSDWTYSWTVSTDPDGCWVATPVDTTAPGSDRTYRGAACPGPG